MDRISRIRALSPDMSQPRCNCCGRLAVPGIVNDALPSLEPIRDYLVPLLKYAREFVDNTPPGEQYDAIDFMDYIALNVVDGTRYAKPAGNPRQRNGATPY